MGSVRLAAGEDGPWEIDAPERWGGASVRAKPPSAPPRTRSAPTTPAGTAQLITPARCASRPIRSRVFFSIALRRSLATAPRSPPGTPLRIMNYRLAQQSRRARPHLSGLSKVSQGIIASSSCHGKACAAHFKVHWSILCVHSALILCSSTMRSAGRGKLRWSGSCVDFWRGILSFSCPLLNTANAGMRVQKTGIPG